MSIRHIARDGIGFMFFYLAALTAVMVGSRYIAL